MSNRRKVKAALSKIGYFWIPLAFLIVFVAFPLFWTLSLSFRPNSEIISGKFRLFSLPPTLMNYVFVWTRNMISVYFVNSLIISFSSIFFITLSTVLAGYAISRYNFRFKNAFILILLMSQMIPLILKLAPIFLLMSQFKLVNTRTAIVLLNIATSIPFNTLLMKGFIGGVPKEIDEAAIIDGCTRFQVILRIIVPVIVPGIVTVMAFGFINSWNEYLLSFTLFSSRKKFPITVGLGYMIGEFSVDYAALAAGSIIALLPPLCLFGYVQKYLIHGLAGAVKG